MTASERFPVEIVAGDHRLTGLLAPTGRRLLDHLNDPETRFLMVEDVALFDRAGGGGGDSYRRMLVRTSSVSLIALPSEQHEAPARRMEYFREKPRYPTLAAVPGYDVAGDMHLDEAPAPELTMAGAEAFFAVTGATATHVAGSSAAAGEPPLEAGVIIVNSARVSLFDVAA